MLKFKVGDLVIVNSPEVGNVPTLGYITETRDSFPLPKYEVFVRKTRDTIQVLDSILENKMQKAAWGTAFNYKYLDYIKEKDIKVDEVFLLISSEEKTTVCSLEKDGSIINLKTQKPLDYRLCRTIAEQEGRNIKKMKGRYWRRPRKNS